MSRIGCLWTGQELVDGDVLNTNAAYIAQLLTAADITVGLHITVSDESQQIADALRYLSLSHDVVLICGGLGPTSDDRTRWAVAKALEIELVFREDAWTHVTDRLTQLGIDVPENNRQQCYFPEGATLLVNERGTAHGCCWLTDHTCFAMLPGPPSECRPLFQQQLLPILKADYSSTPIYRHHWLLLNASEGDVSSLLDGLEDSEGELAYRVDAPYLEVKYRSAESIPPLLVERMREILLPWLVSEKNQRASQQLADYLREVKLTVYISDQATGGALETLLRQPGDQSVFFQEGAVRDTADIQVTVTGLKAYWDGRLSRLEHDSLQLHLRHGDRDYNEVLQGRHRGTQTGSAAAEVVCWRLLQSIKQFV